MNLRDQFSDFMGAAALPGMRPKRKTNMKKMMMPAKEMKMPMKPKGKGKGKAPKARWQQISDQMAKC